MISAIFTQEVTDTLYQISSLLAFPVRKSSKYIFKMVVMAATMEFWLEPF